MTSPVKGGQGRTAADVSADGLALTLFALLAIAVLLAVWGAA